MRRLGLTSIALGMALAIPALSRAQTAGVTISAARHETIALDSSAAATLVFRVSNSGKDSAHVQPSVSLPRGWETLVHPGAVTVAPGGTELWIIGVHAPASAPAGQYVIRATLANAPGDSVVVGVAEHHEIDVMPLEAPGWIISGDHYDARFLVRNRGNVTTGIALSATSSRGARVNVSVPVVSLAPGASHTVDVRISASNVGGRAQDDLVELIAEDQHDASVKVRASSRTTLLPKSGSLGEDVATIPTVLTLRAAQQGFGVSPATISGRGTLPTSKTTIDFSAYVPASGQSPFADRDELRFAIRNDNFSARLGDGSFGLSPLTSNGSLSFGGSFNAVRDALGAGAFIDRSRWNPSAPIEAGAYFGTRRDGPAHADIIAVAHSGKSGQAGIVSFDAAAPITKNAAVALETAVSDSNGTPSAAERAHLSGNMAGVSFDLTHLWSGFSFAGAQRATRGNDLSLSTGLWKGVTAHGYASLHTSGPTTPTATSPIYNYGSGTTGLTFGSLGTIDYTWSSRHDVGDSVLFDGNQRGIRASTFLPVGPLSLAFNLDRGMTEQGIVATARPYLGYGGSVNLQLPRNGNLSFFAQQSDGNSLGGDGRASLTGGMISSVQLGPSVRIALSASGTSMDRLSDDAPAVAFGQADARIDYRLPNETTIGVRGHYWLNPAAQGAHDNNAVYLEASIPLGLPVGRHKQLGRVVGVVSDPSGRPMQNVLVHVGDQVGLTDRRGRVTIAGLATGTHAISVDAAGTTQAMLVGSPTVKVDATSPRATEFAVGVAPAAALRGQVRVLDFATSSPEAADSLVDAGPLQNVTVALLSASDTIYQHSDERGVINFGSVPAGHWTLAVLPGAELPEHHAFRADRLELDLTAGARQDVALQVVPRRRAVTFVGPGETLKVKQQQKDQK